MEELGKVLFITLDGGIINPHWNPTEYQRAKRMIIESIKKKAQEWSVQNILVFSDDERYELFLIHESFIDKYNGSYEYDKDNCLILDYGKVHWKKGFTNEEWKEIEQALNEVKRERISAWQATSRPPELTTSRPSYSPLILLILFPMGGFFVWRNHNKKKRLNRQN